MLRFLRFYGLNIQNQMAGGFLGGSVIKNLPASARDMGFALWPGKIPHAAEQLNPLPELLSPRPEPVLEERNHSNQTPRPRDQRAGTAHRDERKPERQWRPSTAKHQPINKVQKSPNGLWGQRLTPSRPVSWGPCLPPHAIHGAASLSVPCRAGRHSFTWESVHLGEAPGPLFSSCPVSKLCSWVSEDPAEDGAHHLPP